MLAQFGGLDHRRIQARRRQNRAASRALHENGGSQDGIWRARKRQRLWLTGPAAQMDELADDIAMGQGAPAVLSALDGYLDDARIIADQPDVRPAPGGYAGPDCDRIAFEPQAWAA